MATAQQRLEDAREATLLGDHEAALAGFLWFHEHALAEDEALYGVRLSFALGYWGQLTAVYEPALRAMKDTRDRAEELALDPARSPEERIDAFVDTDSLNRELAERHRTVEVLRRLRAEGVPFAANIGRIAIEAVIASGDAVLARECLGDVDQELNSMAEALSIVGGESQVRLYGDQVKRIAMILTAAGESDRVPEVLARAVQLAPEDAREAVLSRVSS